MRENHSYRTAIKRNALSLPARWLYKNGYVCAGNTVLDYGCGRGNDCDMLGWDGYDPHWRPYGQLKPHKTIVSIYVANVLVDYEVKAYLSGIKANLKKGGVAYIAVRRDIKKDGWTTRDTYQTNRILDLPVIYEKKGAFVIYKMEN
jgi:hypothetical protein